MALIGLYLLGTRTIIPLLFLIFCNFYSLLSSVRSLIKSYHQKCIKLFERTSSGGFSNHLVYTLLSRYRSNVSHFLSGLINPWSKEARLTALWPTVKPLYVFSELFSYMHPTTVVARVCTVTWQESTLGH